MIHAINGVHDEIHRAVELVGEEEFDRRFLEREYANWPTRSPTDSDAYFAGCCQTHRTLVALELAREILLVAGDAYWLNGTAYCVECDAPCMSDAERDRATRSPGQGRCGCCGRQFA